MPKQLTGQPTGRPYMVEYDALRKVCEACGGEFGLREQRFQSLTKFLKRRFCSQKCAGSAPKSVEQMRDEFTSRVKVAESGCMEWTGSLTPKGYGCLHTRNAKIRAHRLAYTLFKGTIPDGMMVLHSCDNRPCCNPDHLRIGTAKDNAADMAARGRRAHLKRKAA